MGVHADLLVCSDVEQPTGGIIGSGGEGEAVGKELSKDHKEQPSSISVAKENFLTCQRRALHSLLKINASHRDGIDIRLVAWERLFALSISNVPQLKKERNRYR